MGRRRVLLALAFYLAALVDAPLIAAQSAQAPSPPQSTPAPEADADDRNAPELTSQETPATFKGGVNLVLVPVVVRDRQDHPVGSLNKENFQLFDKGKPQVISRFSVEKSGAAASTGAKNETLPNPGTPSDLQAGTPVSSATPERYIAYVFDDLHISFGDLVRVQKAATHHLATELQPGDRAAIYTTSGQHNLEFTDDRAKLEDAVMRLRPRPMFQQQSNPCPDLNYYTADQIINKNTRQVEQVFIQDTMVCANINQALAKQLVESTAQQMLPMGEQDARVTLSVFDDVVRRMSALPGQRTIVIASPGFLTLASDALQLKTELLDRAARANLVINAIDARGLYTPSEFDVSKTGSSSPSNDNRKAAAADASRQATLLKAQYDREIDTTQADTLAELADGTGGTFFHNNNDLDAGFSRVAAAPEYLYLLGFSPQDVKPDGSFHKLKVTIQPANGLSVHARRGYYAPKHQQSEEENAKEDLRNAVFSRNEIHDFPVDLHTQYFKPDPADAKVTVLARVDLKHIRFRKLVDGRNHDDLTVVAALFDSNGNYVGGVQKKIAMRLRSETLSKLGSGITVKTNFDVKPGTYLVRLVVRDSEGQLMSAQNGSMDIP